jgi:hypothetical protein
VTKALKEGLPLLVRSVGGLGDQYFPLVVELEELQAVLAIKHGTWPNVKITADG